MKKGNWKALLPIGVFLIMYLGLGILFEYGLHITMGFYNIPIVVCFLAALLVACLQNPKLSFDEKLKVMAKGYHHYDSYFHDRRNFCRCCRQKQC